VSDRAAISAGSSAGLSIPEFDKATARGAAENNIALSSAVTRSGLRENARTRFPRTDSTEPWTRSATVPGAITAGSPIATTETGSEAPRAANRATRVQSADPSSRSFLSDPRCTRHCTASDRAPCHSNVGVLAAAGAVKRKEEATMASARGQRSRSDDTHTAPLCAQESADFPKSNQRLPQTFGSPPISPRGCSVNALLAAEALFCLKW
jgi:hypothetical protein